MICNAFFFSIQIIIIIYNCEYNILILHNLNQSVRILSTESQNKTHSFTSLSKFDFVIHVMALFLFYEYRIFEYINEDMRR